MRKDRSGCRSLRPAAVSVRSYHPDKPLTLGLSYTANRYLWVRAAAVHRNRAPDKPADTVYHLDGPHVTDYDAFCCAIGEAVNGPGGWFGGDLFWLHENVATGDGGATPGFHLIWHHSDVARALVPVTGRWPVMICPEEIYGDPTPDELADMRGAASDGHARSVFRCGSGHERASGWWLTHLSSLLGDELAGRMVRELRAPISEADLGRWVYDRMLDDPGLITRAVGSLGDLAGAMKWSKPQRVQVALLPTASQWLAPAWLRYHGAGDPVRWWALAAALYEWERRCGAELVAWWSTMLQFVVSRPPAAGDPAGRSPVNSRPSAEACR